MQDTYLNLALQDEKEFFRVQNPQGIRLGGYPNQLGAYLANHPEREAEIEMCLEETRPIISEEVIQLIQDFIHTKSIHGNSVEQVLYANMTVEQFLDRLITKRPLAFVGSQDGRLLRDSLLENIKKDFVTIGTDKEQHPLVLADYMSYDEMQISVFVGVSSPTFFINDGNRYNQARPGTSGTFEEYGIYVASVGARFERSELVQWQHMIITKEQNTAAKGYGEDGVDNPLLQIFAKFYDQGNGKKFFFPSYEEAANDKSGKYVKISFGRYLNKEVYMKFLKTVNKAYFIDINSRAQGNKVYAQPNGLGLGVWKIDDQQVQFLVDSIGDLVDELKLPNISDINFSWFDNVNKLQGKVGNGEVLTTSTGNNIKIYFSKRNPAAKLAGEDAGKLIGAQYAWDSNSFPGNEYWWGPNQFAASGDPAAVACSLVGALQNSLINKAYVCGKNTYVAIGAESKLVIISDYLEMQKAKLPKPLTVVEAKAESTPNPVSTTEELLQAIDKILRTDKFKSYYYSGYERTDNTGPIAFSLASVRSVYEFLAAFGLSGHEYIYEYINQLIVHPTSHHEFGAALGVNLQAPVTEPAIAVVTIPTTTADLIPPQTTASSTETTFKPVRTDEEDQANDAFTTLLLAGFCDGYRCDQGFVTLEFVTNAKATKLAEITGYPTHKIIDGNIIALSVQSELPELMNKFEEGMKKTAVATSAAPQTTAATSLLAKVGEKTKEDEKTLEKLGSAAYAPQPAPSSAVSHKPGIFSQTASFVSYLWKQKSPEETLKDCLGQIKYDNGNVCSVLCIKTAENWQDKTTRVFQVAFESNVKADDFAVHILRKYNISSASVPGKQKTPQRLSNDSGKCYIVLTAQEMHSLCTNLNLSSDVAYTVITKIMNPGKGL